MTDKTNNNGKNWTFTWNNYSSDFKEILNLFYEKHCGYLIYQEEKGEEGTPHLQGYFQLRNKKRAGWLHKQLPEGFWLIYSKGSCRSNVDYVSKSETRVAGPYEFGTPVHAGQRSDLDDAINLVRDSKSLDSVISELPGTYVRYHRGLTSLLFGMDKPRNFKTRVFWYYGSTGTGKSRSVFETNESLYWKPATHKWWDNYKGESAVIIDDYRRDFSTFAELLRLFDRYPYIVEYKGGSRHFVSSSLYITTPMSPRETWIGRTEEDIAQLLRRIDVIRNFDEDPHPDPVCVERAKDAIIEKSTLKYIRDNQLNTSPSFF